MNPSKKILIAPLDWGLGHTSRCIEIIHALQEYPNIVIYLAASGNSALLFKKNFPNLTILHLKGYNIQYAQQPSLFALKIAIQIPKILSAIKQEKAWLAEQHKNHQFDIVISDNRYGLVHPNIKSIFITHQIQVLSNINAFVDKILLKLHRKYIDRFDTCWIVDAPEPDHNLSGKLAHPATLPKHATYIGLLSQFSRLKKSSFIKPTPNKILLLLSGPEPARTRLQNLLIKQANLIIDYEFILVAGNAHIQRPSDLGNHIQFHAYLSAKELYPIISEATAVICRSGYSTLMDLIVLNKNACLIPTAGQTEQEYLGAHLKAQKIFDCYPEKEFSLQKYLSSKNQFDIQYFKKIKNNLLELEIEKLKLQ